MQYTSQAGNNYYTYRASTLQCSTRLKLLTLIGPGEVKFDLSDFDLKLPANLLGNLIFC